MNSFTSEERAEMDAHAAEMRADGHNGTSDYYSGGWRCYNACRACEKLAGTDCPECGACWWESHSSGCPNE